ncbi:MAG: C2H2-type zinc finger protein [Candidatus Hodarchaeales archaeon]|jgi:bifunctional DNA-binding transcriptional regulator/antitoxin component of YhaV-PrlF toxin-antitoxin module
MVVKSRNNNLADQNGNQREDPLKRFHDLPIAWYSEKELHYHGFSADDIAYLAGLGKASRGGIITVKGKRSLPLIFVKKDRFFLPPFVRTMRELLESPGENKFGQWFSDSSTREEALPILVDNGIVKQGFVNGEPCYYLAPPRDETITVWVLEICRAFNILYPSLSKVVICSEEAKRKKCLTDSLETEHVYLWQYIRPSDNARFWLLTSKKSDIQGDSDWFQVRLLRGGIIIVPLAVCEWIGHGKGHFEFDSVPDRKNGTVVLVLKKVIGDNNNKMTDRGSQVEHHPVKSAEDAGVEKGDTSKKKKLIKKKAVIAAKGRVRIPNTIRKYLGLRRGDMVYFWFDPSSSTDDRTITVSTERPSGSFKVHTTEMRRSSITIAENILSKYSLEIGDKIPMIAEKQLRTATARETITIKTENQVLFQTNSNETATKMIRTSNRELQVNKQNISRKDNVSEKCVKESGSKFVCDLCSSEYSSKYRLQEHIRTVHEGIRYRCELCNKDYADRSGLAKHIKNVHENIRYHCKQCNKEFQTPSGLSRHLKSIHEGFLYCCEFCEKDFQSASGLSRHIEAVHNGVRYHCEFCKKDYSSEKLLQDHIKTIHEGELYFCQFCNKDFQTSSGLTKHIKNVHESTRYHCEFCEKEFRKKDTLQKHIRSAHETTRHHCTLCNKDFQSSSSLSRHVKAVHGGVKYRCEFCENDYQSASDLSRHVKAVHIGVKYPCEFCENEYQYEKSLKRHIKNFHEGRRFICSYCDKTYTTRSGLSRHIEAIHKGTVYKCNKCGKKYTSKLNLQGHIRTVHDGIYYQCEECKVIFWSSSAFSRHRKYYCSRDPNWFVKRHEEVKKFVLETFDKAMVFKGYEIDQVEKRITGSKKRIDIVVKKGKKSIFVDITVVSSKRTLLKSIKEKMKRNYADHCDELWIIVFTPSLKQSDLSEVKNIYSSVKVKIIHYRELYKDKKLIERINSNIKISK